MAAGERESSSTPWSPGAPRRRRVRARLLLGLALLLAALGSGSRGPEGEPPKTRPKPPAFEKRIAQLEPGLTRQKQVERWLGEPDSVGEFTDGGTFWYFRYLEPVGQEARARCTPADSPGVWKRAGAFIGGLFSRSEPEPQPLVTRRFPAWIHELVLAFTLDGVVDDLRYQQNEGSMLCTF